MNKIEYLVKKSYLIGLGFVASMVLLSGYLIVDSLGESEHHGHLINKSGYQRMLSQKIYLMHLQRTFLDLRQEPTDALKTDIKNTVDQFEDSFNYLTKQVGLAENIEPTERVAIQESVAAYISAARLLLLEQPVSEASLKNFDAQRLVTLEALNRATTSRESDYRNQLTTNTLITIGLICLIIGALMSKWLFIVRPLAKDIEALVSANSEISRNLLKTLEGANVATWTIDHIGGGITQSSNLGRVTGIGALSKARSMLDLISHLAPGQNLTAKAFEAILHSEHFSIELKVVDSQMETRWLGVRGHSKIDARGAAISSQGIIEDITTVKTLQERLEQAIDWRQALLNSTSLAFIATDPEGTIINFNTGAEKMLGYQAREVIGKTTPGIFHDPEEVRLRTRKLCQELDQVIEPGFETFVAKARLLETPDEYDWTYITRGDKRVPVRLTVSCVFDDQKKVLGYLAIALDISQLKKALNNAETYNRALNAAAIVAYTDQKGFITQVNDQFVEISGYSRQELLGQTHKIVNSGFHDREFFRELWRTIARGEVWRGEICNRTKQGEVYWVYSTIIPQKDLADRIIGFVSIRFDITSRKAYEQQIIESKNLEKELRIAATEAAKAKARFLAQMSHEIRTPMNGVIATADLLKETELDADQQDYVKIIEESGTSLLAIIDDILDFSKIEAGKFELESRRYLLSDMVESKIKLLYPRARAKGIHLDCIITTFDELELEGDSNCIGQILLNLVGNAIKFTDKGGVVVKVSEVPIKSRETPHARSAEEAPGSGDQKPGISVRLRFEVIDTGIGLTEEHRRKIFNPFAQADSSTSRKYGGTGLGLTICSRLVELLGGTFGIESEIGAGSKFWFEIEQGVASATSMRIEELDRFSFTLQLDEKKNFEKEQLTQYLSSWGAVIELGGGYEPSPQRVLITDLDNHDAKARIKDLFAKTPKKQQAKIKVIALSESTAMMGDKVMQKIIIVRKPVQRASFFRAVQGACGTVMQVHKPGGDEVPSMAESLVDARRRIMNNDVEAGTNEARGELDILVVEDNRINQVLITRLLEKFGHRITIANNGKEALDRLGQHRFDVVFMDCEMPEMNGFEATRAWRSIEAKRSAAGSSGGDTLEPVIIVALTANALEGDRDACIAAGMTDYMTKPFTRQKLTDVLQKWLPQSQKQSA